MRPLRDVRVSRGPLLDVADVDVATLVFGPEGAPFAHRNGPHFRDGNHDGQTDVLAHYASSDTGIAFGDTDACVTGKRLDGTSFEGCDSITTLPPACGEGFGLALVLPVLVTLGRRARDLSSTRRSQGAAHVAALPAIGSSSVGGSEGTQA